MSDAARPGRPRLGVNLWTQAATWAELRETGRLVDTLGYDDLWTIDHLLTNLGDPERPIHEGWLTLAAWAATTQRVGLGLLVGANTFRNPAHVAKMAATLDHISGGRAMLGLGSAWFGEEHRRYGFDFGGSSRERGGWLLEALAVVAPLLRGELVDHSGVRYRVADLRLSPPPMQARMPIVVGGSGPTALRSVARYADIWSCYNDPDDVMRRRMGDFHAACVEAGRDPATITTMLSCKVFVRDDPEAGRRAWTDVMRNHGIPEYEREVFTGPPAFVAERINHHLAFGFNAVALDVLAPFDRETLERVIGDVAPLLVAGA